MHCTVLIPHFWVSVTTYTLRWSASTSIWGERSSVIGKLTLDFYQDWIWNKSIPVKLEQSSRSIVLAIVLSCFQKLARPTNESGQDHRSCVEVGSFWWVKGVGMCWENGKWTSCLSPYNVICIGHSPCMSGEVSEILAIHPRSSMSGKCQCDKLGRPLSLCRNKSTYQILLDIFLTIFFFVFCQKNRLFFASIFRKTRIL